MKNSTPSSSRQVQSLLNYVSEWIPYHTEDNQTWILATADCDCIIYPLRHPDVRAFLVRSYTLEYNVPPSPSAITAALDALFCLARDRMRSTPDPGLRAA